ncbi:MULTISPECIES: hypothetical protein [unclassified Microcoleus]|uniref:hypothetical protein n=1 Tax=unclassified Microcoleus TaxID=2642155 RepID=UPI002FD1A439
MTITVEKFDFDKFTTEKVKFAIDIDSEVFNVSEGLNNQYDQLDNGSIPVL